MQSRREQVSAELESPGPVERDVIRTSSKVRAVVFGTLLAFMALNALIAWLEPVFMRMNIHDMQYESARIVEYYDAPRPDILFMGSSRAGWGFDPDVAVQEIARSTGMHVHALNIGISASTISMNYLILKNIIRDDKKPRIIVYGLAEYELNALLPNSYWGLPYFSLLLRPDDFSLYSGSTVNDKINFLLTTLVPLYRDHELIRNGLSVAFNPDDVAHLFRDKKLLASGYTVWSQPHSHGPAVVDVSARRVLKSVLHNITFGGEQVARLRDFLQLAHERGISVLLVSVPVSSKLLGMWQSTRDINAYERVVRATARGFHVPLLDLYTNPGGMVPQTDFYDIQHLNKTGADLLTRLVTRKYLVPMLRAGRTTAVR